MRVGIDNPTRHRGEVGCTRTGRGLGERILSRSPEVRSPSHHAQGLVATKI